MNIEGSVDDKLPDTGSDFDTSSGSGFDTSSGSGSDMQTRVHKPKHIIKIKICLYLYHGFDVVGEIYPWYQFRSIRISWRGIKVMYYSILINYYLHNVIYWTYLP